MVRTLVVLVVAAGIQLAASIPAHAFEPAAETDFLARINALRAGVGVGPLAMDSELTGVARNWSAQMSGGTGLAHNPNLRSIIDGITSVWRKLGENVGWGTSVAQLHDALVNSPHHYANLVDPAFRVVGIGVVVKGGEMWVTEDFLAGPTGGSTPAPTTPTTARPRATTTTAAAKPATVRTPSANPPKAATRVAALPPPTPAAVEPVPLSAERVRVALEAEQLLEKALRLPIASGASSRAR
jgi:hypothetical protein